jgi:hypothetical protein
MKVAVGMEHLSLKRLCRGASGGAPSVGNLEDMLRKSPDAGISLHGSLFHLRGTWYVGGGSYTGDFDR